MGRADGDDGEIDIAGNLLDAAVDLPAADLAAPGIDGEQLAVEIHGQQGEKDPPAETETLRRYAGHGDAAGMKDAFEIRLTHIRSPR